MSYRKKHITPKIKGLRPKKKFHKRPLFWIIFGLCILVIIVHLILFYQGFWVLNIEISGNKKIEARDIENTVWQHLNKSIFSLGILQVYSKSIFMINSPILVEKILEKFPEISIVNIQRKFPDKLIFKIVEREPIAVFCSDSIANYRLQNNQDKDKGCFFIDSNGVIFEPLQNYPEGIVLMTQPANSKGIFAGENIVNKNSMDSIATIKSNLKNNFNIDIKEVLVSNPLVITTSENWKVYFDTTLNIHTQVVKMNAILKDQIPIHERKKLQYIYLQYQDRAYYK